MTWNFWAPAVVVLTAGLLAVSCAPLQEPASAMPPSREQVFVGVSTATVGDVSVKLVSVADVLAERRVDLVPLRSGRLMQVTVDVGDQVQKGQLIAQLEHGTLDAELARAEAKLANAQARLATVQDSVNFNRAREEARLDAAQAELNRLENPSPLDIEIATSAVSEAELTLESAKIQLDQLLNPVVSQLSDAKAAVAEAESELAKSREDVNRAISNHLSGSLKVSVRTWWEWLLHARLLQEEQRATLYNLRQEFKLQLDSTQIRIAEESIEANQKTISSLMASIEEDTIIPQEITKTLWAETSAHLALEDAQKKLEELQVPDSKKLALSQNQVHSARAELEAARAELSLLKEPHPATLAAARSRIVEAEQNLAQSRDEHVRHDIDAAVADVGQSQAELELVKQQISETRVMAPFDGIVTKKQLFEGAMASPESPVITLAGIELNVSVEVGEAWVNAVGKGQAAEFTTNALPGTTIAFQVDRISPAGDIRNHTFSVRLRPVKQVPDLKAGMSGTVTMEVTRRDVVLVPRKAVTNIDGQPSLFVVQDGKARLRNVQVGLVGVDQVEIRGGVQTGDSIVTTGREGLRDNDPISPVQEIVQP